MVQKEDKNSEKLSTVTGTVTKIIRNHLSIRRQNSKVIITNQKK